MSSSVVFVRARRHCSETDVDAVWQVLVCLTEHDVEEDGEQCRGQDASLLDAVGDGKAAKQRPIVLHLTSLTFIELVENGEKLGVGWGGVGDRQGAPGFSTVNHG